jgi:hypothetical protein
MGAAATGKVHQSRERVTSSERASLRAPRAAAITAINEAA